MAKTQTFADKATKAALMKGAKCPTCGAIYLPVKMVSSEHAKTGASWKFNERQILVCKCNEKEVYA